MLLYKQQSTDGQPPLSVVNSQLKTSTILVAHLTHALRKLLSRIWYWKIEEWPISMLLSVWSYHLEQHIILLQTFRATTKYIHSGCQECWLLKSCWSGCKLPTVISNCKGQILTSFFVDMWPWMRPGFTTSIRKRNNSMQWKHPTSPPVVKFRKVILASKVMMSVFWDSEGVLLTDYLEKGKTVTGTYYAGLIHKLRKVVKEKRRGKLIRECFFTMIMHRRTPLMLPRPLYMTVALNSSRIHLIRQIWLRHISICSDF